MGSVDNSSKSILVHIVGIDQQRQRFNVEPLKSN